MTYNCFVGAGLYRVTFAQLTHQSGYLDMDKVIRQAMDDFAKEF